MLKMKADATATYFGTWGGDNCAGQWPEMVMGAEPPEVKEEPLMIGDLADSSSGEEPEARREDSEYSGAEDSDDGGART